MQDFESFDVKFTSKEVTAWGGAVGADAILIQVPTLDRPTIMDRHPAPINECNGTALGH
jgi:hypothetical protein